jgi:signal transduction histidine kinase
MQIEGQWQDNPGSNGHKMGVGIRGMGERVRLLGGTLEISDDNPGTIVFVKLSVPSLAGSRHGFR